MPLMKVRGTDIHYELHGNRGPWVALTPGGRRPLEVVRSLAGRFAAAGYRVLIHDRRNSGASGIAFDGGDSEYGVWADDLWTLLERLSALPVYLGGSSSGCRMSLTFALRHPESVKALMLWRVTGGAYPSTLLAEIYYGQYIRAAERGGMAAVCTVNHFLNLVTVRPEVHAPLMEIDPTHFIEVMSHWREYFLRAANDPVIGVKEAQLRSIRVPTLIIPGNDRKHSQPVGENMHKLISDSELHVLFPEHVDVDLVPPETWDAKEAAMADLFMAFLTRLRAGRTS